MYCINTFLFYSIIGHVLENIFHTKIDSGILYGYWSCIYGVGALLIIVINIFICKKYKNKLLRPILLFIFSFFLLGFFELISGFILEETFGRVFWNYSNEIFSISKYTSLKMMFVWGFCSILFIYVIHPYMNLIIKKIPKSISLTLAFLFLFDLIYTLITIGN